MGFIFGFLGALLGIIVAVGIIVLYVMNFVKKKVGKQNLRQLVNLARNSSDLDREEYSRIKSVSGMTKILEPSIISDFSDFNKNLLYSMIESNLTKIFDAIENKSFDIVKDEEDLSLLSTFLEDYIRDIKDREVVVSYSGLKFHTHAIKAYEKHDGVATITTSSALEYYYKNSEKENLYADIKKQTRYTCKFVYIYDESKLEINSEAFSINCPNCGAPIKGVGKLYCEYCSSYVEPINLKAWKMSYYKEDYDA